ncbi:hypothetical protein P7C70_g6650, partial [Phenoliferia sp. Uapishka_3]
MSPMAIDEQVASIPQSPPKPSLKWKPVQTSQVITQITNPIREIVSGIRPSSDESKPFLNLGLGDPSVFGNLPPPVEALNAIEDSLRSGLSDGYPESIGYAVAREAVANYFDESASGGNWRITKDDVVMTHGASGALDMAFAVLSDERNNVIFPRPLFTAYETMITTAKATIRYYDLLPEQNWEVDMESLEAQIDENTAFILINNPSNPCGSNWSEAHLREIAALAARRHIVVLSDEVYAGMAWSVSGPRPAAADAPRIPGKFNRGLFTPYASVCGASPVLILGAVSKRWLAPGWRLGWVIVHDPLNVLTAVREGLGKWAFRIQGPNSTMQRSLPALFANTPENFFTSTMTTLEDAGQKLFQRLSTIPGLTPLLPQGCMYLMCGGLTKENFPAFESDTAIVKGLLAEENMLILPGSCFRSNAQAGILSPHGVTGKMSTLTGVPIAAKPLPARPDLPLPSHDALSIALELPTPDADLTLDPRSLEHLEALIRQSFAGQNLKAEVWVDPFLSALHDLDTYLTPDIISRVVESSVAHFRSEQSSQALGKANAAKPAKEREKEKAGAGGGENGVGGDDRSKEERRARWTEARKLLRHAPIEVDHSRKAEAGEQSEQTQDNVVQEEPLKLAHFRLALKTVERSTTLLRTNPDLHIGLVFAPNSWGPPGGSASRPLFGRDSYVELDELDFSHVQLFGGTFELTANDKNMPKLERVLELAAFATLSLKLEAHLLRDTSCPRPVIPDLPPSPSSSQTSFDPNPPLSDSFPASIDHDSPSASPKRGHKSRWSSSNLWGLLKGAASATSMASSSINESGSTTPTGKVKERIKGVGLKLRKSRNRSDSSSLSGRQSMDIEALDNWDLIGSLGQFAGLGIREDGELGQLEGPQKVESVKDVRAKEQDDEPTERFQRVIKKMEGCILSVSPDVIFPPPHLLVRLRKQEILSHSNAPPTPSKSPSDISPPLPAKPFPFLSPLGKPARPPVQRLKSYATIDGRTLANGFASGDEPPPSSANFSGGTMNSLTSQATRITLDAKSGLASLMTNNNSLGGTIRHQGMHFLAETACTSAGPTEVPCKPPTWLTFDYWDESHTPPLEGRPADVPLGQLIERLILGRDVACATPSCKRPGSEHCSYWMHNKQRISVSLSSLTPASATTPLSTNPRDIAAWTTCKTCHAQTPITKLSPASYAYSFTKYAELLLYDSGFVPTPVLCEHASGDRNALVRSFAIGEDVVSLEVDDIELFELRLPTSVDPLVAPPVVATDDLTAIEQLRSDISSFYTSVLDRLDFIADDIPLGKPSEPAHASHGKIASEETVHGDAEDSGPSTIKDSGPSTIKTSNPFQLLSYLRATIISDREALLTFVVEEVGSAYLLNQGRVEFIRHARSIQARLAAWESKHALALSSTVPPPVFTLPDYFKPDVHALPIDTAVLVRESELSSAIAFALSAPALRAEITSLSDFTSRKAGPGSSYFNTPSSSRNASVRHPIPLDFLQPPSSVVSRESTPPKSPRFPFTHARKESEALVLNPDDPLANFGEDYQWTDEAKPKKDVSRGSMLGSIRGGITRQRSSDSASTFGFFRSPTTPATEEPPEHGVEDSRRTTLSDSVLEDLVALPAPSPRLAAGAAKKPPSALPQIMSGLSSKKPRTADTSLTTKDLTELDEADQLRKNAWAESAPGSSAASLKSSASSIVEQDLVKEEDEDGAHAENDSVAPLGSSERPGSRIVSALWNFGSLKGLRGSMLASPGVISDAAHVKYKFSHAEKSFSVTCWYAETFQKLRNCCGLSEDLFIESLSRCTDLNPSGGKSKSAFWMTGDSRFMLKELVNAWGVSEKEAFLTFAPELLKHLMASDRPTILAKIFGFYTVKFKNLKTGESRKLDLIVMEHLFHSQTITRQFDLKGVAGRVAKSKATGKDSDGKEGECPAQQTLWDGDWLAGSLQSRLLIYSHSKTLLRDALLNDSTFLAKCGNIDYSLLVGVNDTTNELVVGLIDIISVFNLAKMLENAGKTALKKATSTNADSVTVIPPADYALRFRQAMEKYFIAVPEKFSRGVEEMDPDPRLASVL